MQDLTALVQRSQRGDSAAYSEIVQRFHNMTIGYGYAKLGDMHVAEDVAQEAFVYAFCELHTSREPAAFPGWFRRVLHGQVNRIQRKPHLAEPALAHASGLEWSDYWHGEAAAIHIAVMHRRYAMIELLLAHGYAIVSAI